MFFQDKEPSYSLHRKCFKTDVCLTGLHNKRGISFFRKRKPLEPCYALDKIDPKSLLIYDNKMTNYIFWSYVSFMPTWILVSSLGVMQLIWGTRGENTSMGFDLLPNDVYIVVPIAVTFTTILAILFGGLRRRSFLRLYYNEKQDSFTAITLNWYGVLDKMEFKSTDVEMKPPNAQAGFFFGNVKIKDKPYFVPSSHFRTPQFYNKMMGWDRPIDEDDYIDR